MGNEGVIGINRKEQAVDCMASGITKICKNMDGAELQNIKCDNMYCPNCWNNWRTKETFKLVSKLEAFAEWKNERIAHVTASIKKEKCKGLKWEQVKNKLYQRAYRHVRRKKLFEIKSKPELFKNTKGYLDEHAGMYEAFKENNVYFDRNELKITNLNNQVFFEDDNGNLVYQVVEENNTFEVYRYRMGGDGGVRVLHPFRIPQDKQEELKAEGWNKSDLKLWAFVRKHVNSSNFRLDHYTELGYHLHLFVVPSYLEQHEDDEFFVQKMSYSNKVEDTIRMVMYVLSHAGVSELKRRNKPADVFGELWNWKPAEHLGEEKWDAIKKKVARKMGLKYDDELIITEKQEANCPNCGTSTKEWIGAEDIIKMTGRDSISHYNDLKYSMGDEYARLFKRVYERWEANLKKSLRFFLYEPFRVDFGNLDIAIIYRGYDPPDKETMKDVTKFIRSKKVENKNVEGSYTFNNYDIKKGTLSLEAELNKDRDNFTRKDFLNFDKEV